APEAGAAPGAPLGLQPRAAERWRHADRGAGRGRVPAERVDGHPGAPGPLPPGMDLALRAHSGPRGAVARPLPAAPACSPSPGCRTATRFLPLTLWPPARDTDD